MRTKNYWSKKKTLNFINEIYLHPEVWDIESLQYKDANIKNDVWALIGNKFRIKPDKACKKFQSLRTYAKCEHRKIKKCARGKQSPWFAYNALSFILFQDTLDVRIDTENTIVTNDIESLEHEVGDLQNKNESPVLEYYAVPTDISSKKREKIADATYEKTVNIINSGKIKNEFSSFGEHIANKLMTYDMSIRVYVEFEISKILFEADKKMLLSR